MWEAVRTSERSRVASSQSGAEKACPGLAVAEQTAAEATCWGVHLDEFLILLGSALCSFRECTDTGLAVTINLI